jgi:hypothetical protein
MIKLTRRGFFKQTTASAATIGVLAAAPSLAAVVENSAPETELSAATLTEPMLAHVRDVATGEVSLMVGEREIIYRDPQLVMRLLRAMH